MKSYKNILVVAAHPDDEVLGCGGTITRLSSAGGCVKVIILGDITSSRVSNSRVEEIYTESQNSAEILGVDSIDLKKLPDNRFDTVPLLDITKMIEDIGFAFQPNLVLCHDFSDLNIDHRLVHQATLTAFRPINRFPSRIMTFETLSSSEFQDSSLSYFKPNCFVDISEYLDSKLSAMKCYKSELCEPPHPRSLEGIKTLASKRGFESSCKYAEAFRIVREII